MKSYRSFRIALVAVILLAAVYCINSELSAQRPAADGASRQAVERWVKIYNDPVAWMEMLNGSPKYAIYGDKLEWVEMPSGRRGGKEELFAAYKATRSRTERIEAKILNIIADEKSAVLETDLDLVRKAVASTIRFIQIFTFDDTGRIVRELHYVIGQVKQ